MSVRVVLVDDHVVLRDGLKSLLNFEADIDVVGDASDGREALTVVAQVKPDIVISDISMPGLNGIESIRILRQDYPALKIAVLSMHSSQEYVLQALQAGANGYVVKQADASEVITAIRAIMAGGAYLSPSISKHLIDDYLTLSPDEVAGPKLTTREREVAQLMAEGESTRTISEALTISIKTVETHRMNIMKKLNAKSPADIIKYALKKGWISLDD
ncbi:MAG: response regulator transcription factor [Chloroflexota bacterium]